MKIFYQMLVLCVILLTVSCSAMPPGNGEKLESAESNSNEQDSNEGSSHSLEDSFSVHLDSDKSKSAEIDSNESFETVEKNPTLIDVDSDEHGSNEEYSKERIPIKTNSNESSSFEDYSNENQLIENMNNRTHSNNSDLDKSDSNESNTTVEITPTLIDVDSNELVYNEEFSKESIPSKFSSNESNSLESFSNENQLVENTINGTHSNNSDLDKLDYNESNTKIEDISIEENTDLQDSQRLLQLETGFQQMKDNVLELTDSAKKGEQTLSELRADVALLTNLLSQYMKDIHYNNFNVSTAHSV